MAQNTGVLELDPAAADAEWQWKVDWCLEHRLNPYLTWVWIAAEQAHQHHLAEINKGE